MPSLFSTRDPEYHKALKRPVAQLFSMTNMKNYETYINECTKIFMDTMHELQGQPVDLGSWLQYYAFDVIASITFQRRFGFMEQRTDIGHMIGGLHFALRYGKIVGQFPGFHPWLVGNKRLLNAIEALGVTLPDPLAQFVKVRTVLPSTPMFCSLHSVVHEAKAEDIISRLPRTRSTGTIARNEEGAHSGQISSLNFGPRTHKADRSRTVTWSTICPTTCEFGFLLKPPRAQLT